jgi:hypothetical protein
VLHSIGPHDPTRAFYYNLVRGEKGGGDKGRGVGRREEGGGYEPMLLSRTRWTSRSSVCLGEEIMIQPLARGTVGPTGESTQFRRCPPQQNLPEDGKRQRRAVVSAPGGPASYVRTTLVFKAPIDHPMRRAGEGRVLNIVSADLI